MRSALTENQLLLCQAFYFTYTAFNISQGCSPSYPQESRLLVFYLNSIYHPISGKLSTYPQEAVLFIEVTQYYHLLLLQDTSQAFLSHLSH